MRNLRTTLHANALAAALVFLPSPKDDPKHDPGHESPGAPVPLPRLDGGVGGGKEDPHQEMRRLFGKIEREMRQIDRLLADASAGGAQGGEAAAKTADVAEGIRRLLDTSRDQGKSVISEIDRILELARHEPDPSSSCESAGGLCQSSGSSGATNRKPGSSKADGDPTSADGKSPLDGQRESTTQREATPQAPEKAPGEPGADKKDRQGADGADKGAIGNRDSKAAARNAPADNPPGSATEAARSGADPADRWGDLPLHVRDVFRAQGGGDMPALYRDWIDAYYRRMAKRAGS
jgi:hypothetical protein